MFKQQLKLLATTTPEKTRQQKPFVQAEGELTEEQLEAIAGGQMKEVDEPVSGDAFRGQRL